MITNAEARAHDRVEPVYLVEIELVGAGAPMLCLAERDIEVDGIRYEGYLLEVGNLEWGIRRIALGDSARALRLRIQNEPWRGYSRLVEVGEDFPFEGAKVYLKEAYIDSEGTTTGSELLFRGVIVGASAVDLMELFVEAKSPGPRAGMNIEF